MNDNFLQNLMTFIVSLTVLEETDVTKNYWCRVHVKNMAADMEICFISNMHVDEI
jgi:hypothetical protein